MEVIILDSTIKEFDPIKKLNYGRKRIILDYDKVTPNNVLEVFDKAIAIHNANASDCDILINTFLGDQDILNRPAPNTSNINNKVVVNYAYPITREIVGYTFGNPIELVAKKPLKQEQVQNVSDVFSYENVYVSDICAAMYASICGFAYQICLPSKDISKDYTPEVPVIFDYIDPRCAFVVYSTAVGNPQIMSCMMTSDTNGNNKKYILFTDEYKFTIDEETGERTIKEENNPVGLDPISMVENSLFLTGDWEQAISVMNALNLVTSDSLNDIEGTIKSLLVLIGAELDDNDETLSKIKEKRLLSLTGGTQGVSSNLDAKFISPALDSVGVENVREFLEDARNVITGIPDRSANSSGGDTGEAVINRDGWTDIEIVAKLKELFFKKAKKRQISVAIKILQKLGIIKNDLGAYDIEVIIGRHTTDNLGTKASAFATLVGTGEIATIDALSMSGLTTRVTEVVERGEEAKEQKREDQLEFMKEQQEVLNTGIGGNYTDTSSTDNSQHISNYNYNYDYNNNGTTGYRRRRRYRRRNYNSGNYNM